MFCERIQHMNPSNQSQALQPLNQQVVDPAPLAAAVLSACKRGGVRTYLTSTGVFAEYPDNFPDPDFERSSVVADQLERWRCDQLAETGVITMDAPPRLLGAVIEAKAQNDIERLRAAARVYPGLPFDHLPVVDIFQTKAREMVEAREWVKTLEKFAGELKIGRDTSELQSH